MKPILVTVVVSRDEDRFRMQCNRSPDTSFEEIIRQTLASSGFEECEVLEVRCRDRLIDPKCTIGDY